MTIQEMYDVIRFLVNVNKAFNWSLLTAFDDI